MHSFLDPAISPAGAVRWASVDFFAEPGRRVRRWRLWEPVVDTIGAQTVIGVLPSVQLLAASYARAAQPARGRSCGGFHPMPLDQVELGIKEGILAATESHGGGRFFAGGQIEITVPQTSLGQRIVYRYPATLRAGERYPLMPDGRNEALAVLPARLATGDLAAAGASGELIRDRIAVIGASYRDSGDRYDTPIGEMSGALVLVNSIASLLDYGEVREVAGWARYAVVVTFILALSLIFTCFEWNTASGVAALAIGLPVILAGVLLFRDGYFLDFVIPPLSILSHRWVARTESRAAAKRRRAADRHPEGEASMPAEEEAE